MATILHLPPPDRPEPKPAQVLDMKAERARIKRERRQSAAMDKALREARAENPDADLHGVILAAVEKLAGSIDFPEFAATGVASVAGTAVGATPIAPAAPPPPGEQVVA